MGTTQVVRFYSDANCTELVHESPVTDGEISVLPPFGTYYVEYEVTEPGPTIKLTDYEWLASGLVEALGL